MCREKIGRKKILGNVIASIIQKMRDEIKWKKGEITDRNSDKEEKRNEAFMIGRKIERNEAESQMIKKTIQKQDENVLTLQFVEI